MHNLHHDTGKYDDFQESGLYETIDPLPEPRKGESFYMNSFNRPRVLKTPQVSSEHTSSLVADKQSSAPHAPLGEQLLRNGKGSKNETTTDIIYDTPVDAKKKPFSLTVASTTGTLTECSDYEVPCESSLSGRKKHNRQEEPQVECSVYEVPCESSLSGRKNHSRQKEPQVRVDDVKDIDEDDYTIMDSMWDSTHK